MDLVGGVTSPEVTMVLGYHFIFSAYGFWLPNDPRGSWSDTIRVYDLQPSLAPSLINSHTTPAPTVPN